MIRKIEKDGYGNTTDSYPTDAKIIKPGKEKNGLFKVIVIIAITL